MIEPNTYRWLQIDPVDAWFFRDGRPSNRGEDQSDIVSEFPPNPSTVVGALRAALARQHGWNPQHDKSWDKIPELKDLLGDGDDFGRLSFLGPLLMKKGELLWPLPQHVTGQTQDGQFVPSALLEPSKEFYTANVGQAAHENVPVAELVKSFESAPSASKVLTTSATTGRLNCEGDVRLPVLPDESNDDSGRKKPPKHPDDMWVTTTGLNRILGGVLPDSKHCCSSDDLFVHEARVGLRRNPESRTTERNDLYSPRYVRLRRGVSLVQGVQGLPKDWTIPELITLGGESRLAAVETLAKAPEFPQPNRSGPDIVCCLTHARFDDAWWGAGPSDVASALSGELKTGTVITAAIDRPRLIGGWSFQSGPLPLRPHVPAGSVWWLEDCVCNGGLLQLGASRACGYGLAVVNGTK